jgi:hypothetical protein
MFHPYLWIIHILNCAATSIGLGLWANKFIFFSLRTSETNYLNEAYSFYAAIRGRAYYSRASKEDR